MMLSAFLRASEDASPPPGDLIFCALSDEESFGGYGAGFMVDEHPELFDGVTHAIGEFGGFALQMGSRRFYPVQVAEKQVCGVKLRVRGAGGHGAVPVRGGAMATRASPRADRPQTVAGSHPRSCATCSRDRRGIAVADGLALRLLLVRPLTNRLLDLLGTRGARARPPASQHRQPDHGPAPATRST